ncbi:MAG TPA: RNA polymerase subunit sigma-70 [Streptosporangiaceae bacterium]|nr:RNA polymerase subunit sigma-70 [Streptosporangiaceae bacterium]
MTAGDSLLHRAHSGDGQAFAELVEPHRRELHVHCYRMLGSFDDADDAVQETLLAAWRGLATFQAKASIRTWLYRVATNTCLNLLRTATRRPQMALTLPPTAPAPTGSEKVTWLQPYPDALLDGLPDDDLGPDARVEQNEAVSLAFITALQLLSPRSRAVLILRDVLGFSAREVAGTLDSTEDAVAMTLSRARASLRDKAHPSVPPPEPAGRPVEATLARRLAAAFTAHDVDTVVSLLAEDVRIAMPPLPAVWEGRQRAAEFLAEVAFRLVPQARFIQTRANRQPALAVYARDDTSGLWHGSGLLVITVRGDQVAALTRFESHTLRAFGLPRILPDDDPG